MTALLLYCFGCYYAIGLWQSPETAHTLHTAVDDWIPFAPVFMWGYVIVYTSLLMPVFVVRCQRLFRRVALSYLLVITCCVVVWLIYPVSGAGLRGDLSAMDMGTFHNWGLRVNYTLDPPMNLFPSLHVAVAVIAALCCWTADRRYGLLAGGIALLISVSICFVKQHFFVDGVAGALLAAGVYAVAVRPYDPGDAPREEVAYDWRGPAGWATLHAGVLLCLKAAHIAGWSPWA